MHKLLGICLIAGPLAAQAQSSCPSSGADRFDAAPSATAYQGGIGSPFSSRASNIEGAGVHAEIASRLPNPDVQGDDAHTFLVAAEQALTRNQTGLAQEALERAETRMLTRSTDPAVAAQPDTQVVVRAIADARLALGQNDVRRARGIIEHVLNPG